jgi:carbonic anhydrase
MEDIARLIAGFRRFQKNYFRGDTELFDQLKEGQRAEEGDLFLHGWYFDLNKGELLSYEAGSGSFRPLVRRPN